jgi:hypothetical protein
MSLQTIPEPTEMGIQTIRRLNAKGMRSEFEPLGIVDQCKEALHKIPPGENGLVLGSGENTRQWKQRGGQP